MSVVAFEFIFIILLVIANGVFAMSEMAVVSSRKARLQEQANAGNVKAQAALELATNPDRFLSTVQIGITLVGILAGAFGGATIATQIALRVRTVESLAPYSEAIGLGIVVLAITYLSLIFGELVPKRLALNSPERVASIIARPMNALSVIASPFVYFLSLSSGTVFRLLGIKPSDEPPVTEEEIKVLIAQGTVAGVFEQTEKDLVERVFRLGDRRIGALMTPRLDIVWLDVNASPAEIRRKMSESLYSRFPVCEGSVDNVIGVVKAKEYLSSAVNAEEKTLQAHLKQPLFVPESRMALQTLESFKNSNMHMALIVDEFGAIEGLVTTNDILEAIVGDVDVSENPDDDYAVQREDGSWLLDGSLPILDFKELFSIEKLAGENRGVYQTLAGFILLYLGHIPSTGDSFEWDGLRFEIVDMDGKRLDKVLVSRVMKASASE